MKKINKGIIFIFILSIIIISYSSFKICKNYYNVKKNIDTFNNIVERNNEDEKKEKTIDIKNDKPKEKEKNIIGKITILQKQIPIIEGTSSLDLENGAAHLKDSVLPGEYGNCAIFGHRDTVFKVLQNLNPGDKIYIETLEKKKFTYEVQNIYIIDPKKEDVVKQYSGEVLTLVTCYPFSYFGDAPKRFVVESNLIKK